MMKLGLYKKSKKLVSIYMQKNVLLEVNCIYRKKLSK